MKGFAKKLSIMSVIALLLVSMSACSLGTKDSKQNNDTKQSQQNVSKVEQDTKKTKQLKKEKQVSDGQVYFQDDSVVATMIIKDNISESDAKALADKYAKELKSTYKDKKVNVQAVQKGKNIANITIEK
ncbi:hypothetical protein N4T77_18295 [Clostridium sp. CX1]|uniref:hypothetical protein n=1 Tax=Clostridium sp. CX1 TaxID=2978346 RepID=UPI0021BEBAF7|nr:hypothetical protein [Clostridium sp. CX1]MCT8978543.1 hypothetical protein [Clostridium sp. CX1]